MIKNYLEKIPVTWASMQLMSIKTGQLCVLLLKTYIGEKRIRSYYFEPPLSKKRSRATAWRNPFTLISSRFFRPKQNHFERRKQRQFVLDFIPRINSCLEKLFLLLKTFKSIHATYHSSLGDAIVILGWKYSSDRNLDTMDGACMYLLRLL